MTIRIYDYEKAGCIREIKNVRYMKRINRERDYGILIIYDTNEIIHDNYGLFNCYNSSIIFVNEYSRIEIY